MRIKYNAPFTLTFSLIAMILLVVDQTFSHVVTKLFAVPGQGAFSWINPLSYVQLWSHILVHAHWDHFIGNFSLILLLGPVLEEKYQASSLAFMVCFTALVTGLMNALLSPSSLIGASGVVFLMILLISFTNIRTGEIPLTFLVIVILYLFKEGFALFNHDNVAHVIHLIGGILGSIFGFLSVKQQPSHTEYLEGSQEPHS